MDINLMENFKKFPYEDYQRGLREEPRITKMPVFEIKALLDRLGGRAD